MNEFFYDCDFDNCYSSDSQEADELPVMSSEFTDDLNFGMYYDYQSYTSNVNIPSGTNVSSPPSVIRSDEYPRDCGLASCNTYSLQQPNIGSGISTSCITNNSELPTKQMNSQIVKKKKDYGNGPEVQKLKRRNKDYLSNEDYREIEIFKKFGSPSKKFFIKLGDDYNIKFKDQIEGKKLERFGRDQKRNMKCAVMFFQKILPEIFDFLIPYGYKP